MKAFIIATLLTILMPSLGFSETPLLTEANSLFGQAVDTENSQDSALLLDKALLRYEQLYRDQPTGRLAYNIGNTYYQMGNKPMALIFYKRAKADIPNDSNLLHNMQLVREELHLENSQQKATISWLPNVFHTYRLHLFLTFYGLCWITASIRYAKKKFMPLAIPLCLLLLTLASSTIIGMDLLQPAKKEGVIISADTVGRQGNGRNFEPSFNEPLPLGTEFTIKEKRGYWLLIQLGQGEECWIPTRSCEAV